ncbi:MAG TPA: GxxExxY protein [Chitinophagales bacterium]|nr:GxxExxY protein [Chitinophagales bacterium]
MTENELSNIIIGEAIYVHKILGPGLLESAYEACLCHRLIKRGLRVERQKPIPLIFDEVKLDCGFRCDILVEGKVIIEVKSTEAINDIYVAIVLTYLKLTDCKLGLIINFNVVMLKSGLRRVVYGLEENLTAKSAE